VRGGGAFDGVPKFDRTLDYVDWLASIRACTVVGILEICDPIPFMCGGGVLWTFWGKVKDGSLLSLANFLDRTDALKKYPKNLKNNNPHHQIGLTRLCQTLKLDRAKP
jgi:hypothetical protein